MAIPKIKRKDKNKKIPILNILLVFFCIFLLILSTFIQLKIIHPIIPANILSGTTLTKQDFLFTYIFIPQIPTVLLTVGILGRKLGMSAILLYILLGLFFIPIFAFGGSIAYMSEFGFGYILAYLPAVFFAGTVLKENYSILNILKATLFAVLTIHVIGIVYMLFIATIRQEGIEFVKGWIFAQSLFKLPYDYIFGAIALEIAKYIKQYFKYLSQ